MKEAGIDKKYKTGEFYEFYHEKGYGFIEPDDNSPNIGFLLSELDKGLKNSLKVGQRLSYIEILDDRKVPLATNVKVIGSNNKTNENVNMTKQKNSPLKKPVTIGDVLKPIVGSNPMPRTEVTKKLWEYIKKNNLQDPKNKRNIIADENLKKVFDGKANVTMFEMTKLVSKHLS